MVPRLSAFSFLQAIVTEEDDMESMAHRFLSAAVKVRTIGSKTSTFSIVAHFPWLIDYLFQLDRKPSKCVVFEDDPRGITAAHNCTMMAIALIGAHPAYVPNSMYIS